MSQTLFPGSTNQGQVATKAAHPGAEPPSARLLLLQPWNLLKGTGWPVSGYSQEGDRLLEAGSGAISGGPFTGFSELSKLVSVYNGCGGFG